MTIYIAIVDSEGNPEAIWTTGPTPDLEEGAYPGDSSRTVVHVRGAVEDTAGFIATHYIKDGDWVTRSASPSLYHNWKNEAWALDSDKLMVEVRSQRDALLVQSDWTQVADAPLTSEVKTTWAEYRQALRDTPHLNTAAEDFDEVFWPTSP